MVRRISKSKKTKSFGRRIKVGLQAAPTDTWDKFYQYFRIEVDGKDVSSILKTYIRKNFSKKEASILLSAPESIYTMSTGAAASIHWQNLKKTFPQKWKPQKSIDLALANIRSFAKRENKTSTRISPMVLLKNKISDYLGELESIVDDWENNKDFSVYSDLQSKDAASNMAKAVNDYYTPLLKELNELVTKKTDDLMETYDHLSIRKRKEYMEWIEKLVKESEQYILGRTATRKPRKTKPKTADKQVDKLVYLKDSNEYRLTSINPTAIIGAMRLYTFNTSNRVLTEYVSRSPKGFEVKGTTLQLWDEEVSRSIRLRKPDDVLSVVQTSTIPKINKMISELTTKPTKVNGRINKYTILVKAMSK